VKLGARRIDMEFDVSTTWKNEQGSIARCKQASLALATTMEARGDMFNPAELLLAALSACIIKGIGRVAPMIDFSFQGLEVYVMVCVRTHRQKWNPSVIK